MRSRWSRWFFGTLAGTVLAASIPTAATRAEAPSLAAKLWRVSNVQADGQTRCEMVMSGRTRDAGGAYTVHVISDVAKPSVVIEHDGGVVAARDAAFVVNGSFRLLALDIVQKDFDRRRDIFMQMPRSAFEDLLRQLEFPQSHFVDIRVGRHSFATVVEGFGVIADRLRACERSLTGGSKE